MENNENVEKIKALFLNKIKGLEWHYFEIDLKKLDLLKSAYSEKDDFNDFLLKIVKEQGEYVYKGDIPNLNEIIKGVLTYINDEPDILKQVILRIFDTSEANILNNSEADEDKMGEFNRKDREYRNKIYKERVREGSLGDKVVIMAEGDSWFEFPRVYFKIDAVKDIVDYLIEDEKYAVYSLAAGGDWLSNMMYKKEYIDELPKISPDVFLISGGGNDMVGNNRLATMVRNPLLENIDELFAQNKKYKDLLGKRTQQNNSSFNKTKYEKGLKYINEEFFLFIDVCMLQYFLFFLNFQGVKKYEKMIFLTQGYDYAKPANKNRGNWISIQRILNHYMDTGKWLYESLHMKRISDPETQEAVVYAMIHEFNEMLVQLANFFPNVFHIDCRGVAKNDNDWFDELHLVSDRFKEIADTYKKCIAENLRNPGTKKVYKVKI